MENIIHVLYVEDEPDIREVTAFALEDEGFELVSCASGKDAVAQAPTLKPDLLLLDVMMPEMDGPTTLVKLRELPHIADIPVIFMTAKVKADEREKYMALGAVGIIAKPFDAMNLADEIRDMLSGEHRE